MMMSRMIAFLGIALVAALSTTARVDQAPATQPSPFKTTVGDIAERADGLPWNVALVLGYNPDALDMAGAAELFSIVQGLNVYLATTDKIAVRAQGIGELT